MELKDRSWIGRFKSRPLERYEIFLAAWVFYSLYSVKTVYCIHLHATLDRSSSPIFGRKDGSGISNSAVRSRRFMVPSGL